jgi:O-succinylbenzoate synthase
MTWSLAHRRYRLPFRAPVRTSHGEWREREGLVILLAGENGMVGYAEVAPLPVSGTETVDQAEAAFRALGGKVEGDAFADLAPGLPCLSNALQAARRTASGMPPPHAHLGVAALLPAGRAALAAAGGKAEAGFRVFKWKVGVAEVDAELGLLDELCAVLPTGSRLRLDANGAWDRRRAEKWLKRCADRPIEYVEQPCLEPGRGDKALEDLLLGLAREFPTPLALDESLAGDGDADRWLGLGWPGVYVVKPLLFADLAGVLRRLEKARAPVVFSSVLETAIGARTGLRAAFEWKGESRALGYGVWPLFADARFDGPATGPFIRWTDVERINPEAVWNALS